MPIRSRSNLLFLIAIALISSVIACLVVYYPRDKSLSNNSASPTTQRYRIFGGDLVGFMDRNGHEVIPCQYRWAREFVDGCAVVSYKGQRALIDTQGRILAQHKVKQLTLLGQGLYVTQEQNLTLRSIHDPNLALPLNYRYAFETFSEGIVSLENRNRLYGCIDLTGKEVIPPRFRFIGGFSQGVAPAIDHSGMGFIDHNGKWVIVTTSKGYSSFSDGFALVEDKAGERHFIDHTGRPAFDDTSFGEARPFHEGLAAVQKRKGLIYGFGFIDRSGKFVIPPKFKVLTDFHEGLAAVELDDDEMIAYIDHTGQIVFRCPDAVYAGPFKDGLAFVEEPDRSGYVDRNAKWVWVKRHPHKQYLDF